MEATLFYSQSTKGFYSKDIHGSNMPTDAVPIDKDYYDSLIDAQTSGKVIVFDAETALPVARDYVPPVIQKIQFSSLEFLERFTEQEQLAVVTATLANAQVKLWYDKMLAASYVDLTDPRTAGGLTALVQAGLLAPERQAEILNP